MADVAMLDHDTVVHAITTFKQQLQDLKDKVAATTDSLLQARQARAAAAVQGPEHRNSVRDAKIQSVKAASALLINLKAFRDRIARLEEVLYSPISETDQAVLVQLLQPIQPTDAFDFPFMNREARWPPVEYESDPDDGDQESDPDDGSPQDENLSTEQIFRKMGSQTPKIVDLYGDTDSEGETKKKPRDKKKKENKDEEKGANDDNNDKPDNQAPEVFKEPGTHKRANSAEVIDTYPRDPSNPWRGADGEPIWVPASNSKVHYRWLIACPVIIDLGDDAPPGKRYAEMECPTCHGNFSFGKGDYAFAYAGLKDHCLKGKKLHEFEKCIVRPVPPEEVLRIVDHNQDVPMRWLTVKDSNKSKPPQRRSDHSGANCYEDKLKKLWDSMSDEEKEPLIKAARKNRKT